MSTGETSPVRAPWSAPAVQTYTIVILLIVYVLSYLDRQIVGILAEPIKRDLQLSDTQVGLMAGFAFSVFYTLLGLPLARLADRPTSNRVRLIALSVAFWSTMTAACGISQSFIQLLTARMGVGLGEAGSTPAAHALISEIVEPRRRASAMALYGMGLPIGSMLAFVLGGAMADAFGWRAAFLLMGVPGLLVALALWVTVKDPRDRTATAAPDAGALTEAAAMLWRSRAFVGIFLAATIIAFLGFGKAIWTASFLIRNHGLSAGQVGLWLGLGNGVAGVFGTWLGGELVSRLGATPGRRLAIPAIGLLLATPFLLLGYLAADTRVALVALSLSAVFTNLYYGPMFGTVQGVVPQTARATAVAVISFGQNMIGLGLGPLAFGILSDALHGSAGAQSLRWVLLAMSCVWPVPALLLWRAGTHLKVELRH